MKPLKVLALVPEGGIPPEKVKSVPSKEFEDVKMEFYVIRALKKLGHDIQILDVTDNLGRIRHAIVRSKPDIAFNMLEEFQGVAVYDHHVISYLELMHTPYTGCNPRGLMISHDKALAKKLLSFHRIRTPDFGVFPKRKRVRRPARLQFPLIVKSQVEEASLGISQASLVRSDEQLEERVAFVHKQLKTDALVEQYIEGRELYVGVLGNRRIETLPVWELLFTKLPEGAPRIATERVKWDLRYQKKAGIRSEAAKDLPEGAEEKIRKICKRVYRVLNLSGYARIDLRLSPEGKIYVLEANPNPDLSEDEDFARSAKAGDIAYPNLIRRILSLGLRYNSAWKD